MEISLHLTFPVLLVLVMAKKVLVNIYGDYISSRGKIENQDFSEINLKGMGSIFSEKNETYGGIGFSQQNIINMDMITRFENFNKEDIRRSLPGYFSKRWNQKYCGQ